MWEKRKAEGPWDRVKGEGILSASDQEASRTSVLDHELWWCDGQNNGYPKMSKA